VLTKIRDLSEDAFESELRTIALDVARLSNRLTARRNGLPPGLGEVLAKRVGMKKAKVAIARKIAVLLG
jgi:hypothetical protein